MANKKLNALKIIKFLRNFVYKFLDSSNYGSIVKLQKRKKHDGQKIKTIYYK